MVNQDMQKKKGKRLQDLDTEMREQNIDFEQRKIRENIRCLQ